MFSGHVLCREGVWVPWRKTRLNSIVVILRRRICLCFWQCLQWLQDSLLMSWLQKLHITKMQKSGFRHMAFGSCGMWFYLFWWACLPHYGLFHWHFMRGTRCFGWLVSPLQAWFLPLLHGCIFSIALLKACLSISKRKQYFKFTNFFMSLPCKMENNPNFTGKLLSIWNSVRSIACHG